MAIHWTVSISSNALLTIVHGELNHLCDFPAERVGNAVLVVTALDGKIVWGNGQRAVGVCVTVALEATDGRAWIRNEDFFGIFKSLYKRLLD